MDTKDQIVPGHVGYAPDYKSGKMVDENAKDAKVVVVHDAFSREKRLRRVVELARPVLQWDRDKAEAWLPGLYDALKALEGAQ